MPKKIEKIVEFILEKIINLQKFPNSFGKKMTSKKNNSEKNLDLTHQLASSSQKYWPHARTKDGWFGLPAMFLSYGQPRQILHN